MENIIQMEMEKLRKLLNDLLEESGINRYEKNINAAKKMIKGLNEEMVIIKNNGNNLDEKADNYLSIIEIENKIKYISENLNKNNEILENKKIEVNKNAQEIFNKSTKYNEELLRLLKEEIKEIEKITVSLIERYDKYDSIKKNINNIIGDIYEEYKVHLDSDVDVNYRLDRPYILSNSGDYLIKNSADTLLYDIKSCL